MRRPTGVGRAGAGAPAVSAPAAEARFVRPPHPATINVIPGFESLAEAAGASFPPQHCRVIALREHGDAGYALFDTRPAGAPYLYAVHYERRGGRWFEGGSGNGPGWCQLGPDPDLGVLSAWGAAPLDADRVRLELDGDTREAPVSQGTYVAVWWDVPCPTTNPRLTAYRVRGAWVAIGR